MIKKGIVIKAEMQNYEIVNKPESVEVEDTQISNLPVVKVADNRQDSQAGRMSSQLKFRRNIVKTNFELHAEICSLGIHNY